jgi:tripartite-type tricarboxylate transporter receptor subunit TctC
MEELKSRLGLDIVHVPYRGFPLASLDLVAGRCQLMFNIPSAAREHMAGGRLSAIAQTGATRLPQLATVPTLSELDPSSKPFFGWSGMVAPTSFPDAAARRIAEVVRTALATDPSIRSHLDRAGAEILGTDGGDLQAWQEAEAMRWNAIIARLGLRSTE